MGKQDYKWTDNVRFGQLPKVERKVITKMTNKAATKEEDHGAICTSEIGVMLGCFERNSWRTTECWPEIKEMYACTEAHGGDPDPRIMARMWQGGLRQRVFQFFVNKRVLSRGR